MENELQELQKISPIGENPLNRFGHTIVNLTKVKICLFGGSVGNSKKLNYNNDTFTYNILTKMWLKINIKDKDSIPKERAAHAAASNDKGQMAIYGGSSTSGGLAEDCLYIFSLNLKDESEGEWTKIKTLGETPGERYGHSLTYLTPYFILFGGNCNPNLSNDIWVINVNNKNENYEWIKINYINDKNNIPVERLYHSSQVCNFGKYKDKLIIFGGRDSKNNPLNDLWALEIKENKGEWTKLFHNENKKDNNSLTPRINHTMLFYDNILIILGGRSFTSNPVPIEAFDIESSQCFKFKKLTMNRHSSFIFEKDIYFFGGFYLKNPIPLGDLFKTSVNIIFDNSPLLKIISKKNTEKNNVKKNLENEKEHYRLSHEVVIGTDGILTNFNNINTGNKKKDSLQDELSLFRKLSITKLTDENKRIGDIDLKNSLITKKNIYNIILIDKFIDVLLRPMDWFDEKKMAEIHNIFPFTNNEIQSLIEEVIPIISKEDSLIKIRSPCKIFGNIYGVYNDLMRYFESYGNPSDSIQNGDINVMQYIFLGDFCDRGLYSLEVVLLLFALKVKYPNFIYLVRGHHEDRNINEFYGLGEECKERLNDEIDKKNSIFNLINNVFDYLPFGILIDGATLLVHGGIGSSINKLEDINNISRPVSIVQEVNNIVQLNIIDLLYSEYDESENYYSINNERDKTKKGFIIKYGKKRLDQFFNNNNINLLITSHQFVKEGFCTFNNDKLLVLFSATNYMDKYNNNGAMITIAKKTNNKRLNIIPKLINLNNDKKELYRKNENPSPVKIKKNK